MPQIEKGLHFISAEKPVFFRRGKCLIKKYQFGLIFRVPASRPTGERDDFHGGEPLPALFNEPGRAVRLEVLYMAHSFQLPKF